MPVIGLLGAVSWRWGWLAMPFAAAVLALVAIVARPADHRREPRVRTWRMLAEDRVVAGWALGELFAWSAWAGALVYAGALFVESYGVSTGTAGVLLGLAAVAYLPGNMLARRRVDTSARQLAAAVPPLAAAIVVVFGAWRPSVGVSGAIFALLAFVVAARTIAGSALGLQVCSERRVFAMRIRTFGVMFALSATVSPQVSNFRNTLSEHASASVATMDRTMWTDERLDERFDNLDRTLERIDRDVREFRTDLRDLRTLVFHLWGSNLAGLLVVIATVLLTRA